MKDLVPTTLGFGGYYISSSFLSALSFQYFFLADFEHFEDSNLLAFASVFPFGIYFFSLS
jgi:hypothetical protein